VGLTKLLELFALLPIDIVEISTLKVFKELLILLREKLYFICEYLQS
jgi:hypothetical protein